MKKHIYYIIGIAATLASCNDDVVEPSPFLNGVEKTPIAVDIAFDEHAGVTRSQTRATDDAFETTDKLVAYFRHVTATKNEEVFSDIAIVDLENAAPRLVNFKIDALTTNHLDEANNFDYTIASKLACTDAQGLYWDDFSVGAKGDATDLRTDGHYLQSYYGYGGYNFAIPATGFTASTGVLTWTVPDDQKAVADFKASDLLWSGTMKPVPYAHATFNGGTTHGKIEIPYSHAMSMFTVEIIARNGFETVTAPFASSEVEIQGVNRTCTVSAPDKSITDAVKQTGDRGDKVSMYGAPAGTSSTAEGTFASRIFQCITVPYSSLVAEAQLLTLKNIDGNVYSVKITSDMLNAWKSANSASLVGDDNKTQPGFNYKITIIVDKQTVSVETTLAKWVTVSATGNGEIQFDKDVTGNQNLAITGDDGVAGSLQFTAEDLKKFTNGSNFDLYELISTSSTQTNDQFGARKTVSTYNSTEDKWVNNPEIYWPNAKDQFYFRAVAKFDGETENSFAISNTGETASLNATQGHDIVWGTTAAHDGYNDGALVHKYQEGEAINPRTGKVPMAFRHIMSKISVNLKTSEPANEGDPVPADAVVLEGALISISNLSTSGTVQLYSGVINNGAIVSSPISDFCSKSHPVADKTKLDNYIVIPQTITDACKITITLANDGGVYSMKLNQCKTSDGIAVNTWAPGRHYEYTITLTKEEIHFQAMVKDWIEVYGHGDANMEWE